MDKAKAGVLRYLGYRNQEITPELDSMVMECMFMMSKAATPRVIRRTFALRPAPDGISLDNTAVLLCGKDIRKRLDGCGQAVLLAATLGVQADNLIRQWENTDLTRSLVLDACATQLIEQYCDDIEIQVCREAAGSGLAAAPRFSPGYGDLPLDVQPRLLAALDAGRKIGLTCTDSFILLPRKSVTALIGLGKELQTSRVGCDSCSINEACAFKRGK